ncbi:MAG: phage tail sheath family protein, partial [Burkholderiaceae bacterium]|nr:phage tail sheath family protein [Burkholderiaceae bacterium]
IDAQQVACWPMIALDGTAYHMSTQLAGLIGQVDSDNEDVPYVSPSNKNFQMTATVLADGSEVWIAPDQGAYLNSQGIVTAMNFIGGWKCWGNRTACYPGVTDVKDSFIAIRRMFNWVGNTLVQSFWQRVDYPLNRRQIDTIVDSANIMMNGWTARQFILGGRVEFLDSENPTTDLMDGIARFHVYMTPPSPNREIDFILEYDPSYIQTLFG